MGRWQPDARGRLERAALELDVECGFEQTTVAQIARRAGLTERTFFRHYADKREVLFGGSAMLQELFVTAARGVPESAPPMDAVAAAIGAGAASIQERGDYARQRQSVIAANPELRERELIKLASLSAALSDTLRERGVSDTTAQLAAEAGIAVFKVGFERWIDSGQQHPLPDVVRDCLDELKSVAAARH
ncbi:MAG: TetR family transcriptional regulator [Streptomycetaceae bacterium]|nr:TetR family transcriptional regulator [Streptomycetaceae bacterium]